MEIFSGLWEHMVMQRAPEGFCRQRIVGRGAPGAAVSALLPDGESRELGSCQADGSFSVCLTGVPTGGPYALILRVGDERARFDDILVGDVWMLAGQSNMQGVGPLNEAPEPDPMVRSFGMDDRWGVAAEPLHDLRIAAAEIHWTLQGGRQAVDPKAPPRVKGVGPGLFFGKEMRERTGVPQGLIASAHGGTTMEQWDPRRRDEGGNSLYGAMYHRFLLNGSSIAGLLWYQGCSDATPEKSARYREANREFFRAFRRDFGGDDLPIVMVQLGRTCNPGNPVGDLCWSRIREIQRTLPGEFKHFLTVPAIDLECSDSIHLSGRGHKILARRMAEAVQTLRGARELPPPIELDHIESRKIDAYSEIEITVFFRNVAGALSADGGLPLGFSLHLCDNARQPWTPPFRVRLEGDRAVVSAEVGNAAAMIAWGYGCAPSVNIHDAAGRSIPAFGPLFFREKLMSCMLSCAEVSEPVMMKKVGFDDLIPSAEKLSGLTFGKIRAESFYLAPPRILEKGDYMRFFRWHVDVPRDGVWRGLLGADGAVRIFVDGKEVAGYPEVANPLIAEEFEFPVALSRGRHEFVVGFNGKGGNAWGISFDIADPEIVLTEESDCDQLRKIMPCFVD